MNEALTDSAQNTLAYLARLFCDGWTGQVTIRMAQGGLVYLVAEDTMKPHDLEQRLKKAS